MLFLDKHFVHELNRVFNLDYVVIFHEESCLQISVFISIGRNNLRFLNNNGIKNLKKVMCRHLTQSE